MSTKILTLFTRTPLHVGAGASVGAVDQPIIRERHTRFPVIPGSSLKGVLADLFLEEGTNVKKVFRKDKDGKTTDKYDLVRIEGGDAWKLFGDNSNEKGRAGAGTLLVGESKLLAFPVRSAKGCFAWITCPTALRRFARDTGRNVTVPAFGPGQENRVYPADGLLLNGRSVLLEEYALQLNGPLPDGLVDALSNLASENEVWSELKDKLAVVSDEMFQYFVENDCEIAQHNCIDDENGVVKGGALFNQENIPSETMFYCILRSENEQDLATLEIKLGKENNLLQIGADVTTGLGWCSVKLQDAVRR